VARLSLFEPGPSSGRVGLGLAAVGRPAYINLGRDRDLAECRRQEDLRQRASLLLDRAHSLGVRYFDAARSYGLAEEFLGGWLRARALSPTEVTCGSKWGYTYVGEWRMDAPVQEVKDHSLAALRRQYQESRQRLGDHLQLYQVHSATLESGVLDDRAVLAELGRLGRSGLAIGLTVSGPRQADVIRRAMEVEVAGENPFSCVQATWNLLEPSAGPALAEAHQAGWRVLVKEAMANGRLLAQGDRRLRPLGELAGRLGLLWDQVALAAALAQPFVDLALSGAVTVDQLESNLRAAEVALSGEDLAGLEGIAIPADQYWAERRRLAWS
jgi:aryl-alcohol dehydrogenase-like predicted oxidoreductase